MTLFLSAFLYTWQRGRMALCGVVLFAGTAIGQSVMPLAVLQDSISHVLARYHVPGAGIALVHKDSVIWAGSLGMRDAQLQQPATATTHYRMGSITKSFVGLGILKLVEQGKLTLQSKVRDIAPEIAIENPWEATHPVRVVHLLEHTSGLDDMHFNDFYTHSSNPDVSLKQAFAIHAISRRVRWQPGTRMAYSNPGYGLAGYVIEKCSGQRFEDFLKKEILLPLAMPASVFRTDAVTLRNLSKGYHVFDNQPKEVPYREIYFRPAGSMLSTPEEMAHLVQFFLNRGSYAGQQILSPNSLERMETPQTTLAAAAGLKAGYGLGVGLRVADSIATYGHMGGIDGFYSIYQYIPHRNVGYVVMLNSFNVLNAANSDQCMTAIRKLLLQYLSPGLQEMPTPSIFLTASQLEAYTGYYTFANPRIQLLSFMNYLMNGKEVFVRHDSLFVKGLLDEAYPLVPVRVQGFRKCSEARETTIFFTSPEGKQVLAIYSDFYEKDSLFLRNLWLYSLLAGLLCMLSSLVFAGVWLFRHRKSGGWRSRRVYGQWGLVGASLCLIAMVVALASVRVYTQLMSVSVPSMSFFLFSLLFAGCTIVGCFLTFKTLHQRTLPVRIYLTVLAVSALGMLVFMSYCQLIGFQSWAW